MNRRFSWSLAFTVTVVAALVLAAFLIFRVDRRVESEADRLERIARAVGNALAAAFHVQPQIVVNDRVFFAEPTEVMELATVERSTVVEHEMSHSWLGSTKRIRMRGVFAVKAGFDLKMPFQLRVSDRELRLELPPAKILSVEQKDLAISELQNGYWNQVTPQDLESEIATLAKRAREKALESGIDLEASRMLLQQLQQKFAGEFDVSLETSVVPQ